MSVRITVLALRPTIRALPVRFTGAATGAALVAVLALHDAPGTGLLLAGMFLAVAATPVLDDRAARTLDPSPTPRWVRRSVRLGLALPALSVAWLLLFVVAAQVATAETSVPFALATWHWLGMVAVALTVSCVATSGATPSFDGSAGVAGLLGVLLADAVVSQLWPRFGVFLLAEPAVSTRLQLRMTGLVAVAVVALAISTRDPARRM